MIFKISYHEDVFFLVHTHLLDKCSPNSICNVLFVIKKFKIIQPLYQHIHLKSIFFKIIYALFYNPATMTTKLSMVVHEQSTIKRRGIYDPVESDPTSDEEDCTYDEEDCTSDEEDVLQGKKMR